MERTRTWGPTPAGPTDVERAIGDCAVYCAGGRASGPSASAPRPSARPSELGGFVWIGVQQPTRRGVRGDRRGVPAARAGRRGRGHAPTSGPSSRSTTTCVFAVLKPVRYVDSEEIVETAEIAVFVGRTVRRHRPPRRQRRPRRGAGATSTRRARGRPARPRPGRGAVPAADRGRRRLRGGGRRDRRRHRADRGPGLRRRRGGPRPAHLQAQAGGAGVPPRRRPARTGRCSGCSGRAARTCPRACGRSSATCTTTPLRAAERVEGHDRLLTDVLSADLAQVERAAEPHRGPPERGHAQDQRLGGHRPGPDRDRRHLRHELRAHARAGWRYGYPAVLAVIAAVCAGLWRLFRRNGWL